MNALVHTSIDPSNRVANIKNTRVPSLRLDTTPLMRSSDADRDGDGLIMKVSETRAERAAAFRLVHREYRRSGLTSDNAMRMRVMKHHLLETTEVLVAKRNNDVEFTVSLVRDGRYGLPAESLFMDEIAAMRSAGVSLAEVSCVASCCEGDEKKRFELFVKMISLTIHAARHRGVDRLLLAVHPRHAKVYKRLFGCVVCTDVKEYEAVQGNPAVLCMHDFAKLDETRYPLYKRIYGEKFEPWHLNGTLMSSDEKRFLERAIEYDSPQVLPMAA